MKTAKEEKDYIKNKIKDIFNKQDRFYMIDIIVLKMVICFTMHSYKDLFELELDKYFFHDDVVKTWNELEEHSKSINFYWCNGGQFEYTKDFFCLYYNNLNIKDLTKIKKHYEQTVAQTFNEINY